MLNRNMMGRRSGIRNAALRARTLPVPEPLAHAMGYENNALSALTNVADLGALAMRPAGGTIEGSPPPASSPNRATNRKLLHRFRRLCLLVCGNEVVDEVVVVMDGDDHVQAKDNQPKDQP
jgi:hypothetical protein